MKNNFIVLLLFIVCLSLTGCSNKLTEEEIKEMLEVTTEQRTFAVNEVTYATEKIVINGIEMQVKKDTVTLGEFTSQANKENNKQITGYYDQPSATYNIYRLLEDENEETSIWKVTIRENDSFESLHWTKEPISKATDLILIDCTETDELAGQTPTRYQVYALVDNELVLID